MQSFYRFSTNLKKKELFAKQQQLLLLPTEENPRDPKLQRLHRLQRRQGDTEAATVVALIRVLLRKVTTYPLEDHTPPTPLKNTLPSPEESWL